jgi:hypothetical protein
MAQQEEQAISTKREGEGPPSSKRRVSPRPISHEQYSLWISYLQRFYSVFSTF